MEQGLVFIAHRRSTSAITARLIRDRLAAHFGSDRVFLDANDVRPGSRFPDVLAAAVAQTRVMLVLVDESFLSTDQYGVRLLDHEDDHLRSEIAAGLRGTSTVVMPVLVNGAQLPPAGARLPVVVDDLRYQQAIPFRTDHIEHDAAYLASVVSSWMQNPVAPAAPIPSTGRRGRRRVAAGVGVAAVLVALVQLSGGTDDRPPPRPTTTSRTAVDLPSAIALPSLDGSSEVCATDATSAPDGSAIVVGWRGTRSEGDPCCADVLSTECKPARRDRMVWRIDAAGQVTAIHVDGGANRKPNASQEFYAVTQHNDALIAAGGSWAEDESAEHEPDEADFGVTVWWSTDWGFSWDLTACDDAPASAPTPTCDLPANESPDAVVDMASNGETVLAVGMANNTVGLWAGAQTGSGLIWQRVPGPTGLPEESRAYAVTWSAPHGAWVVGGRTGERRAFVATLGTDRTWRNLMVLDAPESDVSAMASTKNEIIAVGAQKGQPLAMASEDGGATWRELPLAPLPAEGYFYNIVATGDAVIATGRSGSSPFIAYVTPDDGAVFTPALPDESVHAAVHGYGSAVMVGKQPYAVAMFDIGGSTHLELHKLIRR